MTEPTPHPDDSASLADELFAPAERVAPTEPATTPTTVQDYDLAERDDYLAPKPPRSRLTTGLIVALIFMVGVLTGTVLGKALSPSPAPQIVYVLDNPHSAAPTPSPTTR